MLIPHCPENSLASSLTLTAPLWSYRITLYSPDPVLSPPVARPLAHISTITKHLSHGRVDQVFIFRDHVLQCLRMFHYHRASLTRARPPSSHISPTMCASVDPLGFSQFDTLWSQLLALTPELGKAQSKNPREAVIHIAQTCYLLGELDIVA